MTIRRIVTEDVEGRSRVATDGVAPHTWCDEIWGTSPSEPLGADPGTTLRPLTPPPRATTFRMVQVPPFEQMRAALASGSSDDVDAEGFHRTHTVDYVFVLDGPVELVLDDGSVEVQPGDCVVQRGTNHAWRNHGDAPIRLLAFMVGLP